MKAYYFIEGKLLAIAPVREERWPPDSLAFFCESCGEIWARILVEGREEEWTIEITACTKHPSLYKPAGSLSRGTTRAWVGSHERLLAFDLLPLPLKNREIFALIQHQELFGNVRDFLTHFGKDFESGQVERV